MPETLPRPPWLSGATEVWETPLGNLCLTLNTADGRPFELFAQIGKAGSDAGAFTEVIAPNHPEESVKFSWVEGPNRVL